MRTNAAGASVLAGRQLGAGQKEKASRTVSTIVGFSMLVGIALCVLGILFMEPLLRSFGASEAVLPQAKDYAFWMFIAALFNLPAQSLNCAARAESSVKISSVAVTTGAALNVLLDPVFMFSWGFGMGVEGASLATSISQCVTFVILVWFYLSGRSIIQVKPRFFKLSARFLWEVTAIGIPTAVIQICQAVATSLTNIAAKPLILLFNRNALVVELGRWLLISQVALYPAFGLCYMMTITFQTIGGARMGLFLSVIRQGLFYVPFILLLPKLLGITGIYFSQPAADILTIGVCLALIKPMKQMASRNMLGGIHEETA